MKRLLLFLVLSSYLLPLRAQQVSNVAFTLRGDTLRITYSLDRKADICVRVALSGGPYTEPLKGLEGAVGKGVLPGDSLTITAVSLPEIRGEKAETLDFLVEVDDGAKLVYVPLNGQQSLGAGGTDRGRVMFRMMPVEGGSFTMGCTRPKGEKHTYADELPTHRVTVNSFYMGQFEVTQELWKAVMGTNPSKWTGNDSLPVEQVSWNEAQIFIARLSQITGFRFRLPTEAEWEFAARGGNRSHGTVYPGAASMLFETCWYGSNSDGHSHPVGRLRPNELGIYDMGGNVMEWCSDWMTAYSDQPQNCPQGPKHGENRILRGGCFNSPTWGCSVFERSWYLPDFGYSWCGFRLVLDQEQMEN